LQCFFITHLNHLSFAVFIRQWNAAVGKKIEARVRSFFLSRKL
jgi:hypothetical protein